jgi:hypothetical protein
VHLYPIGTELKLIGYAQGWFHVEARASPASWKERFGGIEEKLPVRAASLSPDAIRCNGLVKLCRVLRVKADIPIHDLNVRLQSGHRAGPRFRISEINHTSRSISTLGCLLLG